MKKSMVFIGMFMLVAVAATSQRSSFVASWGSYQPWNVSSYVTDVVYHQYGDYDWVHTRRVVRHGQLAYRVMLQRGPQFVELTVGTYGRIYRTRSYNYFPLNGHVCSSSCGYHEFYYNSFQTACYSGHHHGHNHVVHRSRPVNYVWGHYYNYPSYVKVYNTPHYKHYTNAQKHVVKNNYPHYQSKKQKVQTQQNRYKRPDPIVVNSKQRVRRQGTYKELEEDRRKGYVKKGRTTQHTSRGRRVNSVD